MSDFFKADVVDIKTPPVENYRNIKPEKEMSVSE